MGKRFEFITRAEVTNKTGKSKNVLINIGILAFIVAFILELAIGQKFGVVFIIPMLYLIKLRKQFSNKRMFADVPVIVEIKGYSVVIVFKNIYYTKKRVLSQKYTMNTGDILDIKYSKPKNILSFHYNGLCQMIDGLEGIHSSNMRQSEILSLYIPNNVRNDLIEALNAIITVQNTN